MGLLAYLVSDSSLEYFRTCMQYTYVSKLIWWFKNYGNCKDRVTECVWQDLLP